jgi:hypothetical protein
MSATSHLATQVVLGASAFWELGAYNTREGNVVMISPAFTF